MISFSDLLSQSWMRFKEHVWTYIGITVVPYLVTIPFIFIIFFILIASGVFNDAVMEEMPTTETPVALENSTAIVILMLMFFITFAVLFFIGIWSQAAVMMKLLHPEVGVKQSYRLAWPRMKAVVGASILAALAILGSMLFFFIPGIIIAVWIFFTVPVCLFENTRGLAALTRSRQIVEGHWWDIVARSIGFWAVLAGIGIVINLVTFGIGAFFLNLVFTPFATIFVLLLYYNLHDIKKKELASRSTKGKNMFLGFIILGSILVFFMLLGVLFSFARVS